MGKHHSLIFQLKENLKGKQRFGQSKKEAREIVRFIARIRGIPLAQMPLDGIFSRNTYITYLRQGGYFIKWIRKAHPEVKTLADCYKYVKEYLEMAKDRGDTAPTLRTMGCALAKIYDCQSKEFGFDFPIRRPENRTRSLYPAKFDTFMAANYACEIEFLQNTGLRRAEAQKLRVNDFMKDFTHLSVIGKGGRKRTIEVLEAEVIKNYLKEHPYKKDLIFGNLDSRLDIHSFRHDYANNLYDKKLHEKYTRGEKTTDWRYRRDGSNRKYDRDIVQIVSENLGHNRVDTSINDYLK